MDAVIVACNNPGFTPSRTQVPLLLQALASVDREQAKGVMAALVRNPRAAGKLASSLYAGSVLPQSARLVEVLGRAAASTGDPALCQHVVDIALSSGESTARRKALQQLGKFGASALATTNFDATRAEQALIADFQGAELPLKRTMVEALGKLGGEQAEAFLRALAAEDAELLRLRSRALAMLARKTTRVTAAKIVFDRALPASVVCELACRRGLARILLEETCERLQLTASEVVQEPERVRFRFKGELAKLLTVRTALEPGLVLKFPGANSDDAHIADALAGRAVRDSLAAWTSGAIRYRVAWTGRGHQRARTWRFVEALSERAPDLINDPVQAPWEFRIDLDRACVLLVPRFEVDPRFSYRKADVPASSHPTLAAALARAAKPQPSDVVWDPFVGSGLELIEIRKQVHVRELHGTDLDPRALAVARENFAAAGITEVTLTQGDALTSKVHNVSLIVTNPPMGRRVARDGSIVELLSRFMSHAYAELVPGGRLVWLSPLPERSYQLGRELGFTVSSREIIDMGGFEAQLQVLSKP